MLQILVLCLALCMDEFVASIAYGADGISINWKETGVMNGICSACLGAALCFGTALTAVVPGKPDQGHMLHQPFHPGCNQAGGFFN